MNRTFSRHFAPFLLLLALLLLLPVGPASGQLSFSISMDDPASQYYKVEFEIKGHSGAYLDLKMPVWTPGYYMVLDLAKNIVDFQVYDGDGQPLAWHKTTKNGWRIITPNPSPIKVYYHVYANRVSVAEPYLAENRGFISPTGIFMHVDGQLNQPVTVKVKPYSGWKQVSTGLDPVPGSPNTFQAENFDRLYDCPILCGNQEILTFEARGLPHAVAIENPGKCNRSRFVADLKKIVEAATGLIGEIPYQHYTFLIMDKGPGGLEHLNSMAVFADVSNYQGPENNLGLLGFLAHEYFHLYNIKTIRPEVLGPFDYDRECITDMLWFSEGGTVYYQDIILNRAGFTGSDRFLQDAGRNIASHENGTGRLFQSAALSSRDTWMLFFNRNQNARFVTINYYNKGATLCLLLDLKIRHESGNRNSLDDVMRTLYQQFHQQLGRGFTDQEFREVCEQMADCPLDEFFNYVLTTREIDYASYLGYAGLTIDLEPGEPLITHLGRSVPTRSFKIALNPAATGPQQKLLAGWLR
ncbi:MAG: hypothetical protein R6V75_11000 [Bacteroidales bacterium]